MKPFDIKLLSQTGKEFEVNSSDWDELLRMAHQSGWRMVGTGRPPITLNLDNLDHEQPETTSAWNGDYRTPMRQMVGRNDANGIALALQKNASSARTAEFVEFCRLGGFVICPGTGTPDRDDEVSTNLTNLAAALQVETPVVKVEASDFAASPTKKGQ